MVSKTSTTMNNYKYADHQGPVAEWEEFVQSAGFPPPPALHLPILEMRAQTNAGRTAIAQAQVRTEGLLFPSHHLRTAMHILFGGQQRNTELTLVRNGFFKQVSSTKSLGRTTRS
jgi:hypothetical protein